MDFDGRSLLVITLCALGFLMVPPAMWVVYWFYSRPMRRALKAQVVIDLVDRAVKDGRPPGMLIGWMAGRVDRFMGDRFEVLASYLANGFPVTDALRQVPGIVTPQVVSMLEAGARMGDLRRVTPVCRRLLNDAQANVESAFHFLFVICLMLLPGYAFVAGFMAVMIMPNYIEIFDSMAEGATLPGVTVALLQWAYLLGWVHMAIVGILFLSATVYIIGPWITRNVYPGFKTVGDWLSYRFAWRRNRCLRDFVETLGLLLDAQVREAEAVELAAACTDHRSFERRAARVVRKLEAGVPLTRALDGMDRTGELRWRMENAIKAREGFSAGLAGWWESIDAESYRQQQQWAHWLTTGVVLYIGVMSGWLFLATFLPLIQLVERMVLW